LQHPAPPSILQQFAPPNKFVPLSVPYHPHRTAQQRSIRISWHRVTDIGAFARQGFKQWTVALAHCSDPSRSCIRFPSLHNR
jgi:hypothetical protein